MNVHDQLGACVSNLVTRLGMCSSDTARRNPVHPPWAHQRDAAPLQGPAHGFGGAAGLCIWHLVPLHQAGTMLLAPGSPGLPRWLKLCSAPACPPFLGVMVSARPLPEGARRGTVPGEGGLQPGLWPAEAGVRGAARAQAAAGECAAPHQCTAHHDGVLPVSMAAVLDRTSGTPATCWIVCCLDGQLMTTPHFLPMLLLNRTQI